MAFWGHTYLFSLGKYLQVELLGLLGSVCLIIIFYFFQLFAVFKLKTIVKLTRDIAQYCDHQQMYTVITI